jgi:hypothetical protein
LGDDDVAGLPNNVGTVKALVESGTVKRKVEAAIAKATNELEFLAMMSSSKEVSSRKEQAVAWMSNL